MTGGHCLLFFFFFLGAPSSGWEAAGAEAGVGVSTASDSRGRLLGLVLRAFAFSAGLVDDASTPAVFDGGITSLGSEKTAL